MPNIRRDAMRALEDQVGLIKFYGGEAGRSFTYYFMLDQAEKDTKLHGQDTAEGWAEHNSRIVCRDINRHLDLASTYVVTDEMMTLAEKAGETVPSSPFEQAELPTSAGFVVLPRPLIVLDVHGLPITARAFMWWSTQLERRPIDTKIGDTKFMVDALMFVMFTSKFDWEQDYYTRSERENNKERWLRAPSLAMVHWMPIDFGRDWGPDDPTMGAEIHSQVFTPGLLYSWMAFLKTFFLLVRQEVAVIEPTHVQRAVARRINASGLLTDPDVKIVTLRKIRPTSDEEVTDGTPVNWSHRWVVDGHWRNQYYPSEHIHRPIWINSFVKGPEHLPLVVKDKVFVWKR